MLTTALPRNFVLLLAACGLLALGAQTNPNPDPDQDNTADSAAPAEPSRECVVVLKSGREIRGMLVSADDEAVVIRVGAIDTAFPRDDVALVRILEPVKARYEALRAVIPDDDLEARLHLVTWLRDRAHYELALREVRDLLAIDPHLRNASDIALWLEEQVKLEAAKLDPQQRAPSTFSEGDRQRRLTFPTLSKDEINLIRVYEIDLDNPPRMTINRDTIQRFAEAYADDPRIPSTAEGIESLYRMPPRRILELMFAVRAREFYGEVIVHKSPDALRFYREKIHGTWLINSCATAQCHGGEEAGRLWLRMAKPYSEETALTNFIILNDFKLADGTPMIDWEEPGKSPLVHLALDPKKSLHPHPQIAGRRRGIRPVFRDTDERRFREAIEWIQMMYRPRPDYPISYQPPVPAGSTPVVPDIER
jgi:hypothetical protein